MTFTRTWLCVENWETTNWSCCHIRYSCRWSAVLHPKWWYQPLLLNYQSLCFAEVTWLRFRGRFVARSKLTVAPLKKTIFGDLAIPPCSIPWMDVPWCTNDLCMMTHTHTHTLSLSKYVYVCRYVCIYMCMHNYKYHHLFCIYINLNIQI